MVSVISNKPNKFEGQDFPYQPKNNIFLVKYLHKVWL